MIINNPNSKHKFEKKKEASIYKFNHFKPLGQNASRDSLQG